MIVAVITSAIGGHPAMYMIGLSLMTLWMPTAPVGLGRAALDAPEMRAGSDRDHRCSVPVAASSRISFPVRPPIVR